MKGFYPILLDGFSQTADVFIKEIRNRAELTYSSSIFFNKKSFSALRLILSLANLSPKLVEIVSISIFTI